MRGIPLLTQIMLASKDAFAHRNCRKFVAFMFLVFMATKILQLTVKWHWNGRIEKAPDIAYALAFAIPTIVGFQVLLLSWRGEFERRLYQHRNDPAQLEKLVEEYDRWYGSPEKTSRLRSKLKVRGWM